MSYSRLILLFLPILFGGTIPLGSLALGASVTLLGSDDLPPKCWLDNGAPRGYALDAAVEALRRTGFEVTIKLEPWRRAVEDAKAGAGFITHFSKTPEREQLFDFSVPLVYDRIVVVVSKGHEFPFSTVWDLSHKTVGVMRGVAYGGDWSAALPNFTLEEDTNAAARLGLLLRGRLDAAVLSSGAAGLKLAANAAGLDPLQFTILPVPVLEDPNFLASAKGQESQATMDSLNEVIGQMHEDGTIRQIMARYGDQS